MLTLSLQGQMSSELSFLKNGYYYFLTLKVSSYVFIMKKVLFETRLIKLKHG